MIDYCDNIVYPPFYFTTGSGKTMIKLEENNLDCDDPYKESTIKQQNNNEELDKFLRQFTIIKKGV